ncbi:hypothetical protein VNI00_002127 [Paramarasmius palmivorus]|uniref:Uncharacterized protein n=1 Tax=Paramarasmius palmivorus TaxID=297713 RepID=A0AAW0E0Z3_9AGAR
MHLQNGVLVQSSCTSLLTQTDFSFFTDIESSQIVDGPGAISARYIETLGKVALKGIDFLVDYAKLRITRKYFPHSRDDAPDEVYDNLLEFCRPGLYHRRIRHQALRVVMIQIAMRRTTKLLRRLLRWPLEQLKEVLLEISSCLDGQWQDNPGYATSTYPDITHIYIDATRNEPHPILPFLDLLLCFTQVDTGYSECALLFSARFQKLAVTYRHPLGLHLQSSLCQPVDSRSGQRQPPLSALTMSYRYLFRRNLWRGLGIGYVTRRLNGIIQSLEMNLEGNEMLEACIDGVEFFCLSQDPKFKDLALQFLLRILATVSVSGSDTLSHALSLFSEEDQICAIWGILKLARRNAELFSLDYDQKLLESTIATLTIKVLNPRFSAMLLRQEFRSKSMDTLDGG